MSWKAMIVMLLSYLAYVSIGGVIFHWLESARETLTRTATRERLANFLSSHTCVNQADLESFLRHIIRAQESGISPYNNATSPSKWDYPSSIFFAGTVVTTIGYGHISPSTSGGRAFCIFYAFIGIPLTMTLLAGIAERLNNSVKLLADVCKCCRAATRLGKTVKAFVLLLIGVLLFFLMPSAVFVAMDGWTYGEGIYYSFITLSTIGFGDYVAGQEARKESRIWYKMFLWLWITLGLAWVAMLIGCVQEVITKPVETLSSNDSSPAEKEAEMGKVNEMEIDETSQ